MIVNGNYEFTKVMLFNIFTPILFLIYFLNNRKNIYTINNQYNILLIILIYLILLISSYISIIPNISLFWSVNKWHWFIFLNNLLIFFIIFSHYFSYKKNRYILKMLVLITSIISLVWIKEYYIPSYNYWDLSNRLLSTLWHPNYVSALLVMIIPYNFYLFKNYKSVKKYLSAIVLFILLLTLLLTKSFIAIFLIILFLFYEVYWNKNLKSYIFTVFILVFIILIVLLLIFPEKLNSLISRFYIWETSLRIVLSDIKIFFFWIWAENLKLLFDNFKSKELYLYENIWFHADRPHNIFLNIWLHYGVFLFWFSIYIFFKLLKNVYRNKNIYNSSLLLIIIFWCFNFPNIIWYLFFIIFLSYNISLNTYKNFSIYNKKNKNIYTYILLIIVITVSSIWWYFSYKQYKSQSYIYQDKYTQAIKIFPYYWEYHYNNLDFNSWLFADNHYYSEKYYLYKIYFSIEKIAECHELVNNFPSIENYLYCWDIIEKKYWREEAKYFYEKWIEKMPDIWDNNSEYLQNKYLNKIINPERILDPKFSNISEILKKLDIK